MPANFASPVSDRMNVDVGVPIFHMSSQLLEIVPTSGEIVNVGVSEGSVNNPPTIDIMTPRDISGQKRHYRAVHSHSPTVDMGLGYGLSFIHHQRE